MTNSDDPKKMVQARDIDGLTSNQPGLSATKVRDQKLRLRQE
jgi:hypothetical protein